MVKEYSFLRKIFILVHTIKNIYVFPFDVLGLRQTIIYQTYSGISFIARSKSTDINEGAAILSGYEYPKKILNISFKKHPVVIDAGAHIGTFTLYVKSINSSAKIYAIEPLSENLLLLNKNIKMNSLKKIICLPIAIAAKSGRKKLWIYNNLFDAGSFIKKQKNKNGKSYTVKTTTLSNIIKNNNIKQIDVLKLDIEGAELEVLKKDITMLSLKAKRILLEYHANLIPGARKKLITLLTSHNFQFDFEHRRVLGFINKNYPADA